MSKNNDIHYGDVLNLKSMQKRIGLIFSVERLEKARGLMDSEELADDEKVRILLDIPAEQPVADFLEKKLTSREIETVRKLVVPGAL